MKSKNSTLILNFPQIRASISGFAITFACLWLGMQLVASEARAITFAPVSVSGLTDQSMVDSLLKTAAIGADHRDLMPATPLGMMIGFDMGVNFTAIQVPTAFSSAFQTVTGQTIPAYIPLPQLNLHKGLPWGLDVGFSYLGVTDPSYSIKMYGGSLKWAFLRGGLAAPAVAVRLTGDYSSLGFLNTHTYKADLLVSKNFFIFDPYIGLGLQKWYGDLSFSADLGPLPATVSGHSEGTTTHYFGGVRLKLFLLKLSGEADYSSAGFTTYAFKVSLGF